MIRMVKGTYGLPVEGTVRAMTKQSGPFCLPEAREAELVAAGVAVKAEEGIQATRYKEMRMTDLRREAAVRGVDISSARTKKEAMAMLEAAEEGKH